MEALGNLSIVLQAEGRLEKAETVVARGMELAPRRAELAYNLGTVLQEAGRHSEGVFRNRVPHAVQGEFVVDRTRTGRRKRAARKPKKRMAIRL